MSKGINSVAESRRFLVIDNGVASSVEINPAPSRPKEAVPVGWDPLPGPGVYEEIDGTLVRIGKIAPPGYRLKAVLLLLSAVVIGSFLWVVLTLARLYLQ